jgi:hypothetical protein
MNKYTADNTVIAAAQNVCVAAAQKGQEPVFTRTEAGIYTTFRQRRLFESAMLEWMTHGKAHLADVNRLAAENIERFRFERYGEV